MKYAHRKLIVVATVEEVRLVYEDQLVARHPRCWERERTRFEPIHYLALLERKPGGFDYARPLENWELPECFALLRRRLEAADTQHGTRSYIRVLRLLEKFSLPQLDRGGRVCLGHRCHRSGQHSHDRRASERAAGGVVLTRRSSASGARAGRDDRCLRLREPCSAEVTP